MVLVLDDAGFVFTCFIGLVMYICLAYSMTLRVPVVPLLLFFPSARLGMYIYRVFSTAAGFRLILLPDELMNNDQFQSSRM